MKYFDCSYIRLKVFFLIVFGLVCSLNSNAQSYPTHKFLYISAGADGPDNSSNDDEPEQVKEQKQQQKQQVLSPHNHFKFIYADFGTAVLNTSRYDVNYVAHGLMGAFGGQVAYKIKTNNDNNNLLLSTGLELRNLNTTFTYVDTYSTASTIHEQLHFWYLGVPVLLQLVNTKHIPGNDNDINYYVQAGITFAGKLVVTESTDRHIGPVYNPNQNYSALMVQPFISAGLSYTCQSRVYLIGPFLAYNTDNINNRTGFEDHLSSYGIRLTALLFK